MTNIHYFALTPKLQMEGVKRVSITQAKRKLYLSPMSCATTSEQDRHVRQRNLVHCREKDQNSVNKAPRPKSKSKHLPTQVPPNQNSKQITSTPLLRKKRKWASHLPPIWKPFVYVCAKLIALQEMLLQLWTLPGKIRYRLRELSPLFLVCYAHVDNGLLKLENKKAQWK